MLSLRFQNSPQTRYESVSWCLETSPLLRLPPRTDLCPCLFCLSFYLLYFVLPPFKDNGLPFWVPDVLFQHSEVLSWNLLSVQMFFGWICGGESGLPVLFLCNLRATRETWTLDSISSASSLSILLQTQAANGTVLNIYVFVCFFNLSSYYPCYPATIPILSHWYFFLWIKCLTNLRSIGARTEFLPKVFWFL